VAVYTGGAGTLSGRTVAPRTTSIAVPALRYWRTRRAMHQVELAEAADVSLISVQRGEAGQALRLLTVRKLARALRVEPDQLMAARPPEP
jgi:transcriptional regulator with XRE-family HTH domain